MTTPTGGIPSFSITINHYQTSPASLRATVSPNIHDVSGRIVKRCRTVMRRSHRFRPLHHEGYGVAAQQEAGAKSLRCLRSEEARDRVRRDPPVPLKQSGRPVGRAPAHAADTSSPAVAMSFMCAVLSSTQSRPTQGEIRGEVARHRILNEKWMSPAPRSGSSSQPRGTSCAQRGRVRPGPVHIQAKAVGPAPTGPRPCGIDDTVPTGPVLPRYDQASTSTVARTSAAPRTTGSREHLRGDHQPDRGRSLAGKAGQRNEASLRQKCAAPDPLTALTQSCTLCDTKHRSYT